MRCPKCAYISFDHLPSCPSCSRGFSEADRPLQGTGISVEAPFFLTSTVGSMVDRVGAMEPEGDGLNEALAGDEVDFQLEPEQGPEDIVLVAEEEDAGGGEVELEADIDLDLGAETGTDEEVALAVPVEPEEEDGEEISLVLADEPEPEIEPAGEELPLTAEDGEPEASRPGGTGSGKDEVLLDFTGLDDLDQEPGTPDGDQPDLEFADEQGFEDLFTDLDLFEDSGDDPVADSPAPPAGEETELTLALDDEQEKPAADPGPGPKPAAPDSGLTLEIEDE